jgi:hypothetical protein
MKVLNVVVDGTESTCIHQFPSDAHIDVVTIKDFMGFPAGGEYDAVYCHNCMQILERHEVVPAVKKLSEHLREDGELWMIVPALEWIAKQILGGPPDPIVHMMLFGADIPFRSGFTLHWMRGLIEAAGIIVRMASQQAMELYKDEEKTLVPLNIVIGIKHNMDEDRVK